MEADIKLFIVKYKWEIIQVDWICDWYTEVQVYSLNDEIKGKNKLIYSIWEAKDLVWIYWDIEIFIQDFIINL